jgi:hypothetical protein
MAQYMFSVGDNTVTGTLADFTTHWRAGIYGDGPMLPCLLTNTATGETTRVKVDMGPMDEDLEAIYVLSVGDDTATTTVSDLA